MFMLQLQGVKIVKVASNRLHVHFEYDFEIRIELGWITIEHTHIWIASVIEYSLSPEGSERLNNFANGCIAAQYD